ncbi:vitellogenin-A1-like [Sitodiplosis mosellana]|uniref:vitellogenin-A1-like n=1 Tax=Sitodiplosis mosellana TaxID=263140 RepID=UPI0024451735|nr:vitellogenin-A1-like [Sitodiplosis mosellana]
MMKTAVILCFLVALGAAKQHDGAWQQQTQYRYKVHTQSVAAIPNLKNQWVGTYTKADLIIAPFSNDVLIGKLQNGEQSEWHDALPEGPAKHLPEEKLSYRPMEINSKPFEIRLNEGVIHSIAVDKQMTNVELNQLKSILSQLQVDIQARNAMESQDNHLPQNQDNEDNHNQALFKVMEPTVTGKCESFYDISRVPLYLAQAYPEYDSNVQLQQGEHFYEVYKTKNYTNCEQRLGYHFGIHGMNEWKPSSNLMGSLTRSAVSRIIISGSFEKFTIRSSVTTNRVVKANPEKDTQHDSMVVSQVNLTLVSMEETQSKPQIQTEQLIDVGNLVYSYDLPSDSKNSIRPKPDSSESEENDDYDSNVAIEKKWRNPRSIGQRKSNQNNVDGYEDESIDEHQEYYQPKPTLKNAPENPFLNYFVGYKGQSIQNRKQFNAPTEVQKLVAEIVQDLQEVSEMPVKYTLRKFNVLTKVIRTMNAEQIEQTTRYFEQQDQQTSEKSCKVYRDALLSAGTGPAINELMGWIEEGKLKGEEAAEVIAAFPKTIREPTQEMQQRFFDFVKNDAVKNQWNVNTTAGIAFTRFMFRGQTNNKASSKYYPVNTYGRLADRDSKFVSEKVIPYFAQLLDSYVKEQDAANTLYAIRALGNLGHSDVANVFEPYLTGEERVSDFQRLAIVLAMDKYMVNNYKEGQVITYKLYQNKGETNEVRSAAVFQLIRANPTASVLQRLAEETNTEESNDVRAAVRSALESAARLTNPKNIELARNAKAALNLLKPEKQGVQYSRTYLRDYTISQIDAAYEQQSSYFVNGDSFIPSGVYVNTVAHLGAFARRAEYQAIVSSVEELINAFNDNINSSKSSGRQNNQNGNNYGYYNYNEDSTQQQSVWSAKKIMSLLNMKPNQAKQQLEGQIFFDILGSKRFFAFDKQSFAQNPHQIMKIVNELRNGADVKYTKFYNQDDVTISFPLETGIPFTFTFRTPMLVQVNGQIRVRSNPDMVDNAENQIRMPETVNVTGEIDAVYAVNSEVILSFINPSTSQRYTAGYDKKVQVHVPIRISSDIDLLNHEIKTEFKPLNAEKSTKVLQMGSWPFTARDNIFDFRPLPESQHTKEIHSRPIRESNNELGENETGYVFVMKGTQERDSNQIANVFKQLRNHGLTSFFMFGQQYMSPQHYSLNVMLDAKRSTTKATKFTFKYDSESVNGQNQYTYQQKSTHPRARGQSADGSEHLAIPVATESNSQPRREQFMRNAAEGIPATNGADVLDVSVEFVGQKKLQYVATISGVSSKTEGKSRILFFAQKSTSGSPSKAMYLQVDAKYQTADEFRQQNQQNHQLKPFADVKFKLSYSLDNVLELATVEGKFNMKQSTDFHKYMQQVYNSRSSVETPFVYPNTVDHIDVEVDYQNAPTAVWEKEFGMKLSHAYKYVRYTTLWNSIEDTEYQGQKDKVAFEIRFSPDMRSVNLTLKAPTMKTEWNRVHMPSMTKNMVVVPTNWNIYEELKREFIQNRDTCTVFGQETNTFENRTVKHGTMGNTWHLAVHKMHEGVYTENQNENNKRVHLVSALVRDAQQSDEVKQQTYNFVDNESKVYGDAKKNNKEVLIVLHQQNKNDITVQLSPSTERNNSPRLFVNGKEQDLSQSSTVEVPSTENPNEVLARVFVVEGQQQARSLRVETTQGNMQVTYDGQNVQFRSKSLYRNNRGICGSFNGQNANEMQSPQNKVINNDKEFAASWAVVNENSATDNVMKQLKQRIQQKQYPTDDVLYSHPVPKMEKSQKPRQNPVDQVQQPNGQYQNAQYWEENKQNTNQNSNQPAKIGTKHQTQFVEDFENQRIYFSKRPLPVCPPGTKANGKVIQNVEVVGRDINDPAAQQYKEQIQRGRNVDMSNYATSTVKKFAIPKRCERQM